MRFQLPRSFQLSEADQHVLRERMRTPAYAFVALLAMLGVIVLLGGYLPFRNAWMLEATLTFAMVLTVLLFSMEVLKEEPILRVFSFAGFFWVLVLMGMTVLDFLTR